MIAYSFNKNYFYFCIGKNYVLDLDGTIVVRDKQSAKDDQIAHNQDFLNETDSIFGSGFEGRPVYFTINAS